MGAMAQPSKNLKDGFYRVKNFYTGRYAYIMDSYGVLNKTTTSGDIGALALYPEAIRNRFVDPASVIYVKCVSNKHDLMAQNTGFFQMIEHYVQIQDGTGTYNGAYKMTPWFEQKNNNYVFDQGYADLDKWATVKSDAGAKNDYALEAQHHWRFLPVNFSSTTDEYLAIAPKAEMQAENGKYYVPYIVGFSMSFLSDGMKAYYVSEIKSDAVLLKEIKQSVIPANTPIIVECSSLDFLENRVMLHYDSTPAIVGNKLSGQYFCYGSHTGSDRLYYNYNTMLIPAVDAGKLVFKNVLCEKTPNSKGQLTTEVSDTNAGDKVHLESYTQKSGQTNYNVWCIPHNSAYLKGNNYAQNYTIPVVKESDYRLSHYTGDAGSIAAMIIKKSAANMDADFNGDGKITIADLALYVDYLKNK